MEEDVILDYETLNRTYLSGIPKKQKGILFERRWLSVKKDSELARDCAYLVGKIMGDGHLSDKFEALFISGNKQDLEGIRNLLIKSFEIEPNRFSLVFRNYHKGSSYVLSVRDCLFGRLLFCLGAPKGNKTKTRFLTPDWILNSIENSKAFLQAILEDELTTIKIDRCSYAVTPYFKLAKDECLLGNLGEFLEQIRYMLNNFGINSSSVKQGTSKADQSTKELYLRVYQNKENIVRFSENVGFRLNSNKIRHLQNCVRVIKNNCGRQGSNLRRH